MNATANLRDAAAGLTAAADLLASIADEMDAEAHVACVVGPERLAASLLAVPSTLPDTLNHIRTRLGQYDGTTPASQVYADWFGAA